MTSRPYFKKFTKFLKHFKPKMGRIAIPILLVILSLCALLTAYIIAFSGKVYPNISVAGVFVGGGGANDAESAITEKVQVPDSINLIFSDSTYKIYPGDVSFSLDATASARNAYEFGRSGGFFSDLYIRINLLIHPKNLDLVVNLDEAKLTKILSVISGQISEDPIEPSVKIINGTVSVDRGAPGREVDQESLKTKILADFSSGQFSDISVPVTNIDHTLNPTEADTLKSRTEKYVGKAVQMKFEFNTYTYGDSDLIKLLDPKSGFNENAVSDLINKVSILVTRDPQNPKFTFDSGRVTVFQPALDGIRTDNDSLRQDIINSLNSIETGTDKVVAFDIPVLRTAPEVTTESVNNLGIKELIGRGTSTYFHSIPGRVHNVVLAASRINGTLVKPGETFSFNNTLGDVSSFTGYQQAYIISEGKTILGDGGGVCQVSTTLFRAVLNAGLPVNERAAHAYRVGYYEQDSPPGLDATVYGPSPDLKFTNDTANYILIEAIANPKNYSLIFELYGTSDGRVATITKPVVSNVVPALPTVYQDDPTLPAGSLKQTDFSAAGATVKFNYTVKKAGEIIYQKTFVSNYRPWAAVYLRGTAPAI
jgi:vancomycin resistance protein YoaR